MPAAAAPALDAPRAVGRLRGFAKSGDVVQDAALRERMEERRKARFAYRERLLQITRLKRIRGCGKHPTGSAVTVTLRDGVAHYGGLQTCGYVWFCPVCAPKIRSARAAELDQAARTWLQVHGPGAIVLVTLTLPHDAGEELATVLGAVREAFAQLVAGRRWQDDKDAFGIHHYVRAHDLTHGPNGWHPHVHLLLFLERAIAPAVLDELRDRWLARWTRAVDRLARRLPSPLYGVAMEPAAHPEAVTEYLAQVVAAPDLPVALELCRADLKASRYPGHRTPWQVLEDWSLERDPRDRALWREYEHSLRGVHSIRWSRGLRAAVGLGLEATDAELAAAPVGGEVVWLFDLEEWRWLRSDWVRRVAILEAAERDGPWGIRALLADWRAPP